MGFYWNIAFIHKGKILAKGSINRSFMGSLVGGFLWELLFIRSGSICKGKVNWIFIKYTKVRLYCGVAFVLLKLHREVIRKGCVNQGCIVGGF